jgi:hypothetical protein
MKALVLLVVLTWVVPKPTFHGYLKPQLNQPEPERQVERVVRQPSYGRSIKGKASWYCSVGIPICHYKYPPGSMVAAACYKLRQAMGPNWRGKTVRVTSSGRHVTVKLVDWCGSKDKLIDLYREPMRRLGGDGVLPVRVSW